MGYPTLRLKGHYLAMATLAIGLIVYEVAVQWQSVTNGYMGISGIPPLGIGSYELDSDRSQLIFLAIVATYRIAPSVDGNIHLTHGCRTVTALPFIYRICLT